MAADADIETIADDLFGLFGVDRSDRAADSQLWLAMASHIFPALTVPPAPRGRAKGTRRGQSLSQCVTLAERYDAFAADLRRKHPGTPDNAVMPAFIRKNKDVLKPFKKGTDNQKDLSYHTLHRKLTVGRKYCKNIDTSNILKEISVLESALDYAPFAMQVLLRDELARLDLDREADKDRLLEIAKEIAEAVPTRVSIGLVTVSPYWNRRSAK